MGICKFQDIWKTFFSWVLPVPENAHKAKCKYCPGKLIDIKCGSQALKRHEACSIHKKAVTSVAGSNIVAQMQAGTSVEEGKLKEPVIFKASATSTIYSNIPFLFKELCQKSDEELKIITNNWNCFNEYLIKRLLIRFNKFLGSQIVRKMYIIFQSSRVYSDVTIRHLKDLSRF